MPDLQISIYAVGVIILVGSLAAIARGFRGDVREIVDAMLEPMRRDIASLRKAIDDERDERRRRQP